MQTRPNIHRLFSRPRIAGLFAAIALPLAVFAQSGTGTITGRVFNPGSGEYVRNAEVRIQGTNLVAISADGGVYQVNNVPAGTATLTVSYTGYNTPPSQVDVLPGQTVSRDLNLASSLAPATSDRPLQMQQFVVSSEKEGNAKAIMQQRNSMNVGTSVSADVFGDVAEGNIGEFLKFLPGVELEYVEADTRGPRLGGMDPEYAGVTIDGMKLASADAFVQYGATENGSTGSGSRSFGFEQVSINSIESIEISRVASSNMDADAPAGTINLKTKRAFDRKGRRIAWQLGTTLNSEQFTLHKTHGPNDGKGYKFRPNLLLDYSDVFFNNRLGLLVSISESNLYNEQYRIDHTYNRTTTAGDGRPQVLTQLAFKDGPKWTERFTATATADYKVTPDLFVGLTASFNAYDARFYNRTVTIAAATNNTAAASGRQFVAGNGVTTFGTNGAAAANRSIALGGGSGFKFTNTLTLSPRFEFKRGAYILDGAFAYSRSKNDYENLVRRSARTSIVNSVTGIGFIASRSAADEADWQILQTSGPDWANPINYTNPRINDEGRYGFNEVYNAELNLRYAPRLAFPTFIRLGAKFQERTYKFENAQPIYAWSYVGPGGNTVGPTGTIATTGTFANLPSPHLFDLGTTGGRFRSLSGGGSPPFANNDALGAQFFEHPEYFVSTVTPANWETYLGNSRRNREQIDSAYVMGNSRLGAWQVQAGVRWEGTGTGAAEYNPLTNREVAAAGFPVAMVTVPGNPTPQPIGNPTTIPGVMHKYTSRPRITREGDYDDFFPSITGKYRVSDRFIIDLGFAQAIKRPDINKISGVWQFNESALEITAPNPNLQPERSTKLVASAGYYFGTASSVTLTMAQTNVKGLPVMEDISAEDFGVGDFFPGWTIITSRPGEGTRKFRNLEFDFRQRLAFLPDNWRHTGVFANYSRTTVDERRPGIAPHKITGGFDVRFWRATFRFSGVWTDDTPWTNTVGRVRRQKTTWDTSGSILLFRTTSFFFQGRNIFNESHRVFEGSPAVLQRLENYGANWTMGIKGSF